MACINCRLSNEWTRNQLFHVLANVVEVDVCVVAETWLSDNDNSAMQVEAENAGFQWIGVTRVKGKGGGVGILIKSHLQWQKVSNLTGNVIWVHVKGIGYVAGVYAPPRWVL